VFGRCACPTAEPLTASTADSLGLQPRAAAERPQDAREEKTALPPKADPKPCLNKREEGPPNPTQRRPGRAPPTPTGQGATNRGGDRQPALLHPPHYGWNSTPTRPPEGTPPRGQQPQASKAPAPGVQTPAPPPPPAAPGKALFGTKARDPAKKEQPTPTQLAPSPSRPSNPPGLKKQRRSKRTTHCPPRGKQPQAQGATAPASQA
jgi:zinc transporter 1/2/3